MKKFLFALLFSASCAAQQHPDPDKLVKAACDAVAVVLGAGVKVDPEVAEYVGKVCELAPEVVKELKK
jgi:hypothetical protein